jgi:hypothetical protein
MPIELRQRWNEDEVAALPMGEHDYFERKSGALFAKENYRATLGKAVSAFANSGGGHLVLGVQDDGRFDGMDEFHKAGRTKMRDWLEQIIPNLVSHPLKDFRVHEVEPSTPSAIPAGRIVIAIDIGDSRFAPHQSEHTKLYYYRAGGRSEPAAHFYLETLRGRETYPGPKIARAWFDMVINPLLEIMESEQLYLESGKWKWSYYEYDRTEHVHLLRAGNDWANLDQFLEEYTKIRLQIEKHNELVTLLLKQIEQLYDSIRDSQELRAAFRMATEPQQLLKIRESDSYHFSNAATPEEILRRMFSDTSEAHCLAALAELVLNEVDQDIEGSRTFAPLWNAHRQLFLMVNNYPNLPRNKAHETRQALLDCVRDLAKLLKEVRRALAFEYRVPYNSEQRDELYRS